MAQFAPETPTTEELHETYPLETEGEIEISLTRQRVGEFLKGEPDMRGLVAILGPCAMNDQVQVIAEEGATWKRITERTEGLQVVHRMPPWKPRTNPKHWHGRETTDPEGAFATLTHQANNGAGVAVELATAEHVRRYGDRLSLGWFGGRNVGNAPVMDWVAQYDLRLPLAVKNGLDGELTEALGHVARLNSIRGDENAPAVLLYRGGENAKNPQDWEWQYRTALEITAGRMIVDVAHGTEMAHDPSGLFEKSADGQEAALQHVVDIAERYGEMPNGIMAEASKANTPTDPHISTATALAQVLRLHNLFMAMHSATNTARIELGEQLPVMQQR